MHEFRLAINVTEVPDVIITTHLQYLEVRSKDTKWCKGEPSRTCTLCLPHKEVHSLV